MGRRSRMASGHRAAARSVLDGRAAPCHARREGPGRRERRFKTNFSKQLWASPSLGMATPWILTQTRRPLTISIDFVVGTRFPAAGVVGEHPVHDTQIERMRHLNFFQHECFLNVRTPRVKTPDGKIV